MQAVLLRPAGGKQFETATGCQSHSIAPLGPHSPCCLCLFSSVRFFCPQLPGVYSLCNQLPQQRDKRQRAAPNITHSVNTPVKKRIAVDFFLNFIIAPNISFKSCLFSLKVTAPRFSLYFPTAAIALSRVFP